MNNEYDKDSFLFLNMVMMFQAAAMQYMGKIKNPATDKIEKDLNQAQFAIDTLDMLAKKTKGNLNENEDRMLAGMVRDLKLNYVDELSRKESTPTPSDTEPKTENPQ